MRVAVWEVGVCGGRGCGGAGGSGCVGGGEVLVWGAGMGVGGSVVRAWRGAVEAGAARVRRVGRERDVVRCAGACGWRRARVLERRPAHLRGSSAAMPWRWSCDGDARGAPARSAVRSWPLRCRSAPARRRRPRRWYRGAGDSSWPLRLWVSRASPIRAGAARAERAGEQSL